MMKRYLVLLAFAALSCSTDQREEDRATVRKDEEEVIKFVGDFNRSLRNVYGHIPLDLDSLMNVYFARDMYYVTYWGITEPIDSTKSRLRRALPKIKDYENRFEAVEAKAFGNSAYVFFTLRQSYSIDGHLLEEYLPTTYVLERLRDGWKIVHAHRSADIQTIQQLMRLAQASEQQKGPRQ